MIWDLGLGLNRDGYSII